MIEDVTLDIELDKPETSPVAHDWIQDQEWTGSMEFTIDDDEDVEMLAKLTNTPIVRVNAPEIGWDGKPFIPKDP